MLRRAGPPGTGSGRRRCASEIDGGWRRKRKPGLGVAAHTAHTGSLTQNSNLLQAQRADAVGVPLRPLFSVLDEPWIGAGGGGAGRCRTEGLVFCPPSGILENNVQAQ